MTNSKGTIKGLAEASIRVKDPGVMAQSLSNFGMRIISSALMETGRYSVTLVMNDRI